MFNHDWACSQKFSLLRSSASAGAVVILGLGKQAAETRAKEGNTRPRLSADNGSAELGSDRRVLFWDYRGAGGYIAPSLQSPDAPLAALFLRPKGLPDRRRHNSLGNPLLSVCTLPHPWPPEQASEPTAERCPHAEPEDGVRPGQPSPTAPGPPQQNGRFPQSQSHCPTGVGCVVHCWTRARRMHRGRPCPGGPAVPAGLVAVIETTSFAQGCPGARVTMDRGKSNMGTWWAPWGEQHGHVGHRALRPSVSMCPMSWGGLGACFAK